MNNEQSVVILWVLVGAKIGASDKDLPVTSFGGI
jgi:hypothetical protein